MADGSRLAAWTDGAMDRAVSIAPVLGQILDIGLSVVAPRMALQRSQDRLRLRASYEAAKPSRHRKMSRDASSGNALVERSAFALRNQARHLERNHDIAAGILDVFVRFAIGPEGISVEPTPKTRDGKTHTDFARALDEGFARWCRRPEVTRKFDWKRCQRLAAASWFRDGEAFAQAVIGTNRFRYSTPVPFALELLEADFVPLDYHDIGDNIRQGIQTNAWGEARNFFVHRQHPGDSMSLPLRSDLKTIPAERMFHLYNANRVGQLRGVSQFASIMTRLEDLKEFEEYERIAAKLAAAFTAAFKRNSAPVNVASTSKSSSESADRPIREVFSAEPGMLLMDMDREDEVQFFEANRPNPHLEPYRNGQLKGVAAGGRVGYSSVSRNYDGTYSAQRQELVEQWPGYQIATSDFICEWVRPIRETWIDMAVASGQVVAPPELALETLYDADYRGPRMPWIDPEKEAKSFEVLVRNRFKSPIQVIREINSAEWRDVLQQFADFFEFIGENNDLRPVYTNDPAPPPAEQKEAA